MNDLKIFNNMEFGNIRAAEIDGKPHAVGVDVARALGYAKPSQAVIDHCRGIRKLGIPHSQENQYGYIGEATQETNMIPESDIYRLLIKAADQSRNPDIKIKAARFEKWIFEDVLPSIRKHGAYITTSKMEEILNDPDTLIKLASTLKEERLEKERLKNQIENDKPKIIFADAVSASDGTVLIGELAKILKGNGIEVGQNRLFERLRLDGFLIKRNGTDYNMPSQKAMELGLFELTETPILHNSGTITISKTTRVTGKGQQFFLNYFLARKEDEFETDNGDENETN
jgi:anti-repressor protein